MSPTILPDPQVEKALKQLKQKRRSHGPLNRSRDYYKKLFNNGDGIGADVVVRCGPKEWKAHSLILKTSCDFFRACLEHNAKSENLSKLDEPRAANEQNEEPAVVHMDDQNEIACGKFLEFLYTRNLEMLQRPPENDKHRAMDFQHPDFTPECLLGLCRMADKYDVPDLLEQIIDFMEADPLYVETPTLKGHLEVVSSIMRTIREFEGSHLVTLLQEVVFKNIARLAFYHGTESCCDRSFGWPYERAIAYGIILEAIEHTPRLKDVLNSEDDKGYFDLEECPWCNQRHLQAPLSP